MSKLLSTSYVYEEAYVFSWHIHDMIDDSYAWIIEHAQYLYEMKGYPYKTACLSACSIKNIINTGYNYCIEKGWKSIALHEMDVAMISVRKSLEDYYLKLEDDVVENITAEINILLDPSKEIKRYGPVYFNNG